MAEQVSLGGAGFYNPRSLDVSNPGLPISGFDAIFFLLLLFLS